MSVQSNGYVIYGIILDHEDFRNRIDAVGSEDMWEQMLDSYRDSAFEPAREGGVIVDDGMSGEYTIIGITLVKTEVYQGFTGVPNTFVSTGTKVAAAEFVQKIFHRLKIEPIEGDLDFQTLTFTHYR